MGMMAAWSVEEDGLFEEGIRAAVQFLRREIDDLLERAEALDLPSVMMHLQEASNKCSLEVPDY